ncbi:vitelline membrane outer layer protein 1-like [Carassius carassius]|uniref:vitelline membrane outer layer protein 1-like n=1 Tax=Carassius carassius TaxID=217509 RepID=UPI00286940EF|nr:vitelline membrane outer layer protein 1-like [Carassius carassius]
MHHFISLLLFIIGLHVSIQSVIVLESKPRNYKSVLTVSNGMNWGSWKSKEICPTGMYAAGFSLKVEELSYGVWDDNTALNGIRLHCIDPSKAVTVVYHDYATVQSEVGSWGQWTKIKWCPFGLLTAFQLRVVSSQGIEDDTAVNNIRFRCTHGTLLMGDGTGWGDWGGWSSTCEGLGICGIMTRVEEHQGTWGDDTALNDVRMICCD